MYKCDINASLKKKTRRRRKEHQNKLNLFPSPKGQIARSRELKNPSVND